jgi:hypothetical protein
MYSTYRCDFFSPRIKQLHGVSPQAFYFFFSSIKQLYVLPYIPASLCFYFTYFFSIKRLLVQRISLQALAQSTREEMIPRTRHPAQDHHLGSDTELSAQHWLVLETLNE